MWKTHRCYQMVPCSELQGPILELIILHAIGLKNIKKLLQFAFCKQIKAKWEQFRLVSAALFVGSRVHLDLQSGPSLKNPTDSLVRFTKVTFSG